MPIVTDNCLIRKFCVFKIGILFILRA